MNYFEQELRRLFGNDTNITDKRFVGRALFGKLTDNLRVRIEFVTLGIADHYEAIKASNKSQRRSGRCPHAEILRPARQENGQQPKLQGWYRPVYMEVWGQNRMVCLQTHKSGLRSDLRGC